MSNINAAKRQLSTNVFQTQGEYVKICITEAIDEFSILFFPKNINNKFKILFIVFSILINKVLDMPTNSVLFSF